MRGQTQSINLFTFRLEVREGHTRRIPPPPPPLAPPLHRCLVNLAVTARSTNDDNAARDLRRQLRALKYTTMSSYIRGSPTFVRVYARRECIYPAGSYLTMDSGGPVSARLGPAGPARYGTVPPNASTVVKPLRTLETIFVATGEMYNVPLHYSVNLEAIVGLLARGACFILYCRLEFRPFPFSFSKCFNN